MLKRLDKELFRHKKDQVKKHLWSLKNKMEEIQSILIIWIFAYFIEYFKSELDISMFNVLIFINLIAVFYLLRDIKFSVTLGASLPTTDTTPPIFACEEH